MDDIDLHYSMRYIINYRNVSVMMLCHLLCLLKQHLKMTLTYPDIPVIITDEVAQYYRSRDPRIIQEFRESTYVARKNIEKLILRVSRWIVMCEEQFDYFQGYDHFESNVCSDFDKLLEDYFKNKSSEENKKRWDDLQEFVEICSYRYLNYDSQKANWLAGISKTISKCDELNTLLNAKLCFVPKEALDSEDYVMGIIQSEMQNHPWTPTHYLEEAKHRYVIVTLMNLLHMVAEVKNKENSFWILEKELKNRMPGLKKEERLLDVSYQSGTEEKKPAVGIFKKCIILVKDARLSSVVVIVGIGMAIGIIKFLN
ncbi:uncharacterized protein Eint_040880 [Encephalitozoon intestinalis ATCC 50506]|uniref:Uncharacterized protein n=1 Tax=Encephalitozoon intestinalis (strain ATCC 50506) TaxID=876142 RepID=E0S6P2_ENCIT|nr:uncharacterized protein Eint_040880 [Encephalitozoon intestinalis ATCC 50506]ADM11377.1 hypothetical protein Eint_040880 [Encephalitozoon intestinalis ATCC 50506]UTX45067.1 hypothetical protein GPK93_04g06050 [Encephalitozoon intestinalis]